VGPGQGLDLTIRQTGQAFFGSSSRLGNGLCKPWRIEARRKSTPRQYVKSSGLTLPQAFRNPSSPWTRLMFSIATVENISFWIHFSLVGSESHHLAFTPFSVTPEGITGKCRMDPAWMPKVYSGQRTRGIRLRWNRTGRQSSEAARLGQILQTDRKIEIARTPRRSGVLDSFLKAQIYCWAFSFGRSYAFCMYRRASSSAPKVLSLVCRACLYSLTARSRWPVISKIFPS
jgi:hypothetical protein